MLGGTAALCSGEALSLSRQEDRDPQEAPGSWRLFHWESEWEEKALNH